MTEAAYFMQASFHSEDIATSMPQASLLSIGAVAHITGIPEATLRLWERRYQFPRTTRSTGGHRLYEQKDVIQLQWVRGRLDEGMRVHRAVEALHQWTQAKEQDNAIERAVASALAAPLPLVRPPDPSLVSVQHSLLEAVLAYNSERATMILHEATGQHALGLVVLEVVRPTLSAIGELWSVGQIEVATEHFATNLLRHQLLEWMRTTPPPYQTSPVVLACAPEELHEGSLLMLGVLLRRLRWPVLYLGQSLPLSDLGTLVERVSPSLIVFVAMSEITALALADWPQWLIRQGEAELPIIGYGGRAFTENTALADLVPGVLLGTTIYEGYQRIHRVMLNLTVLQNVRTI